MRIMMRCGVGLLTMALVVGGVFGQSGDLLQNAKERQKLETERVEKYIHDALAYADKELIQKGRDSEALSYFRKLVEEVKNNSNLPEERRQTLIRDLQARVTRLDHDIQNPAPRVNPPTPPSRRPFTDEDHKAAFERAGKTLSVRGVQLVDARNLNEEKANRLLGVNRDIEKSSLPPIGDYELPADWAEKSKRRLATANPMTDEERKILTALNTPIEVKFEGEKFKEVIDYLQKVTGQTISIDPQALMEANVGYDTTINFNLRRASTRTVLKKILGDVGLTYIVKDQTIFVTTPARAKETLTTRSYYVGDLVGVVNPRIGPIGNQLQQVQQINQMLVLLQQTIEPESWESRGGLGTIYFNPATMTFVVSQTAEVHFMMGVGLRR